MQTMHIITKTITDMRGAQLIGGLRTIHATGTGAMHKVTDISTPLKLEFKRLEKNCTFPGVVCSKNSKSVA